MVIFFSEKPNKTLAALKKLPDFAFRCLQALVSRLLTRNELSRYKMLFQHMLFLPMHTHR